MKIKFIVAICLLLCLLASAVACSDTDAVSIISIDKTATNGLVDTYTIYYSDGTTSTFEVTNGADGENGKDGADGKDGENGIDGKDGTNGKDGKDGVITAVSISSIQKTGEDGLVDIYTVFYTDGSTSTFEITNGADGKDGENGKDGVDGKDGENGNDITALSLYETYKEISGSELTFEEFLSLYLTFDATAEEKHSTVARMLSSTGKVFSTFTNASTSENYFASGACVIYQIDEDYTYFITNYHVIFDHEAAVSIAPRITCYLYGSEWTPYLEEDDDGNEYVNYGDCEISCEYVGGSITYDLAILKADTQKVKSINENISAVTFAEDYYVGETAIAIGNPNGEGISVTEGIISVDNENISLSLDRETRTYRSMRIDTALYHGNSGGGLFNCMGELIGITNAGDGTDQNINFAIPLQIVKAVADNIIYYEKDGSGLTYGVYKTTIGVTVQASDSRYVYDTELGIGKIVENINVIEVVEGGKAEQMGLVAGDIITAVKIDGREYTLERFFEIGDIILTMRSGMTFSFIYKQAESEEIKESGSYTLTAGDFIQVE